MSFSFTNKMTKPQPNKRLNTIITKLFLDDRKKVLMAIDQLRKQGKKEAISPLIEKLSSSKDIEIKHEISNLLFDLKNPLVVDELISCIQDEKFASEKATLISIFWQSSLDGSQHISTFIKEAIKGDYLVGIEVLSVLDNFDATFQEIEIEDLKYDLEEAIELEQTEKVNLLISIKSALDSLNLEF